jgi:hypothetical protein
MSPHSRFRRGPACPADFDRLRHAVVLADAKADPRPARHPRRVEEIAGGECGFMTKTMSAQRPASQKPDKCQSLSFLRAFLAASTWDPPRGRRGTRTRGRDSRCHGACASSRAREAVSSSAHPRNQFPWRRSNFGQRRQSPETIAWHYSDQSEGRVW